MQVEYCGHTLVAHVSTEKHISAALAFRPIDSIGHTFIVDGFTEETVAHEISLALTSEISIGIRANSIAMARIMKAFIDI
jgi:hypothetical protein